MIQEAIILAGGLGTRLRAAVPDKAKAMAPIDGRPFLEYQLQYLNKWGVRKVVVAAGYRSGQIMEYFGHAYKGMHIAYSVEEVPLGTGGAIISALPLIKESVFLVLNGDTYFDVNLKRLDDFRKIHIATLCMALKFMDHPSRYGRVEINPSNRITGFREKAPAGEGPGLMNGGLYMIDRALLEKYPIPERFSFEKEFLQKYFGKEAFYGMKCHSYFIDIGLPEDYKTAQNDLKGFIH